MSVPPKILRLVALMLVTAGLAPSGAAAQVGHPPGASPYHDLRISQGLAFGLQYMSGGKGSAGVGPHNGYVGGLAFDIRLAGPVFTGLSLGAGSLTRVIIDPSQALAARIQDTVSQSLIMASANLRFVLTGQKSWNGFVPYLGGSLGAAFGGSVPEDASGFTFATKFQIGPTIGFDFHPARRINLRVEGRDVLWKLSYPSAFLNPPANAPNDPPVLDPTVNKTSEWVHHPTLFIGLGYALKIY